MSETFTCSLCGRTGTRQFIRAMDPKTGVIDWRCNSFASCLTRVWERDAAAEKARTVE